MAALIHRASARASGRWVSLNCAALPASLAEAELFGVRCGAFTGAHEHREGLFQRASAGTLFLDEVGELALELQPKLLVALETGRVRPLGGSEEVTTGARVIAATNVSPETAVAERRLRADLFFRLNVVWIEIPPLRERLDDLPRLVDALLGRAAERGARSVLGISQAGLRHLAMHAWPGNIRELANVLERAVIFAEHDVLEPADLHLGAPPAPPSTDLLADAARQRRPLEAIERAYIEAVLQEVGGVKQEAARILGIDRRTLYRKIAAPED